MAISETARRNHERLFPGHTSLLAITDPELIKVSDNFAFDDMKEVIAVIGAGSIGQAIVRRVSAGKHVLLADIKQENADAAAKVLYDAGFNVSTATVDVSSRPSVQTSGWIGLVAEVHGCDDRQRNSPTTLGECP